MQQNQSQVQKLDLLAIFHYVLAAMIYLKGAIAFIFFGIGALSVAGILSDQPHDMAAGLVAIGIIFFLMPMIGLVLTWTAATLVLVAGRRIARRTHLAYCQVIAGLECLCVPFGTVLGVFSLIKLTQPEIKALFTDDSDPAQSSD